jgi:hypothetical protein
MDSEKFIPDPTQKARPKKMKNYKFTDITGLQQDFKTVSME